MDSITSQPVSFATVSISSAAEPNKPIQAMAADEKGKFLLKINTQGDYILNAQLVGKKSLAYTFSTGKDQDINLGTLLMNDDSEVLNEIVVSAQKPLVKADIDKISYSVKDDPDSKTNNVLDIMKKVPLITVDGEDNIKLKGSSNFKIYLNGKPSNLITNNPKDVLKSMPASAIKDVEVITEPGAKYDAEGVDGIINIITDQQSSMGGYTVTLNSWVNEMGNFGAGAYFSVKKGKLGFTGNYNYYKFKNPTGHYSTFRENLKNDPSSLANRYLYQKGEYNNKGNGQYGYGELSYELDTLNLFTLSYNRYSGNYKGKMNFESITSDYESNPVSKHSNTAHRKYEYNSDEVNFNYQRTFSGVKERLLTASYKYSHIPNNNESESEIENIYNYHDSKSRQFSDSYMNEHTFQIDFTTPFAKVHNVEAGIKYIIRNSNSTNGYSILDDDGNWISINTDSPNNKFKHYQDIIAAYAGYSFKYKSWGIKTGLRFETTNIEAKFPLNNKQNFKNDYTNLVPSVTMTYQLKPTQSIRLGYNMRLMRPGIWQLNPYSESNDSSYVTVGNPDLDVVKNHVLSLNYGFYATKFNMNVNLSYNFANNSVEDITEIIDQISYSTYKNIGKIKRLNASVYFNWTINSKLQLTSNLNAGYSDLRTNNEQNFKNHGFNGGVWGMLQYTLPKNFKLSGSGNYYWPWIGLQDKGSSYYSYNLSINKSFKNERINLRLSANNPFNKNIEFENTQQTTDYRYKSSQDYRARNFMLTASFRFGEMKTQIKKAERGITNDDVMQNQSSGGQGSGGQ